MALRKSSQVKFTTGVIRLPKDQVKMLYILTIVEAIMAIFFFSIKSSNDLKLLYFRSLFSVYKHFFGRFCFWGKESYFECCVVDYFRLSDSLRIIVTFNAKTKMGFTYIIVSSNTFFLFFQRWLGKHLKRNTEGAA